MCINYSQSDLTSEEAQQYMGCFEQMMDASNVAGSVKWAESEQLRELIALATPIDLNDKIDAYLNMDIDGVNEFEGLKKTKDHIPKALPRYSKFMNLSEDEVYLESLCSNNNTDNKLCDFPADIESLLDSEKNRLKDYLTTVESRLSALAEESEKRSIEKQERERQQSKIRIRREESLNTSLATVLESVSGNDFDSIKKKVDTLLKHRDTEHLFVEEIEVLFKALFEIYQRLGKKRKVAWTKPYAKNYALKKTVEWIGKEEAEKLFNQITNQ